MNVYEFASYRDFLKAALLERTKSNPAYSLRAMARDCGLASSTLSEAMNSRANLSVAAMRKIGKALRLKTRETDFLCELAQLDGQKDPTVRMAILNRLKRMHPQKRALVDLTIEHFKQIADWYHPAILELALIKGFELNSSSVASALDIPKVTADLAIDRLKKLNLLVENSSGHLERADSEIRIKSEVKSAALRQFYRQMFEKASTALERQTPQERLSGFLNLPISVEALPEVDEAISRFFDDVRNIASKYENQTEVYHLMVHFLNLTQRRKRNENSSSN